MDASVFEDEVLDSLSSQMRTRFVPNCDPTKIEECAEEFKKIIINTLNNISEQELQNKINTCLSEFHYGNQDYWLCLYDFIINVLNIPNTNDIKSLIELSKNIGWFWVFEKIVFISEKPLMLCIDDNHRLHNFDGPAIEYKNGIKIFSVHGVRVPAWIIESPEKITSEKILDEQNAEIRRIMMDKYTPEAFIKNCNAKIINQDDWGTLYQAEIPGDEPLTMVKVVNSTPSPEGGFHDYYLRVPPTMKTAHEAVAWTFDKTPETYHPEIQT